MCIALWFSSILFLFLYFHFKEASFILLFQLIVGLICHLFSSTFELYFEKKKKTTLPKYAPLPTNAVQVVMSL